MYNATGVGTWLIAKLMGIDYPNDTAFNYLWQSGQLARMAYIDADIMTDANMELLHDLVERAWTLKRARPKTFKFAPTVVDIQCEVMGKLEKYEVYLGADDSFSFEVAVYLRIES